MNKILIKCDGEVVILDTIRTVSDIRVILELNRENYLFTINNITLEDEGFKDEVVINPRFVTLVKDITPSNYWSNKIVLENDVYGWPTSALAKEIKDNKIVFFNDEEIAFKDLRIKNIEHSKIILTKKEFIFEKNSIPLVNKNKMEISESILKSNEVAIINTGELGLGKVSISKEYIEKQLNKPFSKSFELEP